ncbi:MAG: hypothetical protein STSR0003_05270 [Smithella sp.]
MKKLLKNKEAAGTPSAKTGKNHKPQDACPDDAIEDLLDSPLPAG